MALYAFDGTWNEDESDEGKDTNVVRFRDAYLGNRFYLEGVGTRLGFIGKILGGLTGAGGKLRIHEAMNALDRNLAAGDAAVDIVGFSRGSALALHFANEVSEHKAGAPIRFLGLWDTVASFGVPGNELDIGWTLTLPENVERCFHAMSLDERRGNFPVTRVLRRDGSVPPAGTLREVWFRGVHSDVGGGQSVGLSHIALCWMIRRAQECGLAFDEARLAVYRALCNADDEISRNFDPKLDPPRRIRPRDLVHESVKPRQDHGKLAYNNPPPDVAIERA